MANHFLFNSYAFLIDFLFMSYGFPIQFLFISYSILIHFLFISYSFPIQFLFISYSILEEILPNLTLSHPSWRPAKGTVAPSVSQVAAIKAPGIKPPKTTGDMVFKASGKRSSKNKITWATKKHSDTFYYTDCLKGILKMVYHNPHITG